MVFVHWTDISEVLYKVDNYYRPSAELGLLWNDKDININWPFTNPKLSEKDSVNLTFAHFISKYNSIKV